MWNESQPTEEPAPFGARPTLGHLGQPDQPDQFSQFGQFGRLGVFGAETRDALGEIDGSLGPGRPDSHPHHTPGRPGNVEDARKRRRLLTVGVGTMAAIVAVGVLAQGSAPAAQPPIQIDPAGGASLFAEDPVDEALGLAADLQAPALTPGTSPLEADGINSPANDSGHAPLDAESVSGERVFPRGDRDSATASSSGARSDSDRLQVGEKLEAVGNLEIVGNEVVGTSQRWTVGNPGDVVALVDLRCDGTPDVVLLQPDSGNIFWFEGFAQPGEALTAQLAGTVPGATALDGGAECSTVRAMTPAGPTTLSIDMADATESERTQP